MRSRAYGSTATTGVCRRQP